MTIFSRQSDLSTLEIKCNPRSPTKAWKLATMCTALHRASTSIPNAVCHFSLYTFIKKESLIEFVVGINYNLGVGSRLICPAVEFNFPAFLFPLQTTDLHKILLVRRKETLTRIANHWLEISGNLGWG